MIKCNFEEFFDDYLLNRLPEKEKDMFEEHYHNCPYCFENVVERDEIISIIKSKGESIFKDMYISEEAKRETWFEKISSFLTPKQWVTVVASTLIIISVFVILPMLTPKFSIVMDSDKRSGEIKVEPLFPDDSETVPSKIKWTRINREDIQYKVSLYDNGNQFWSATTENSFIILPEDVRQRMAMGERYLCVVEVFSPVLIASGKVQFNIRESKKNPLN